MLPASDMIVVADGKRFFNEALPKALSANQAMLKEVFSHIDAVQTKTGIDLRKFESIAAGVSIGSTEAKQLKAAPVVIARGTTDSAMLIEAAKKASEGKFKEEIVNGKTMFIVTSNDAIALAKKNAPVSAKAAKHQDKVAAMLEDVAFAATDSNTIVAGYASRVRQTLEGTTKVSPELVAMLGKKPAGIANFAAKVPGGMSSLLPLDNDMLGQNIDAIKAVYGAVDVANSQATINVTAVTEKAQQAEELRGTLDGLKNLGKSFLVMSRAPNNKVYAKLLNSVKLSNTANELNIDLAIPQADIDAVVSMIKK